MLEQALELVENAKIKPSIFPCIEVPGPKEKKPYIKGGEKFCNATNDPNIIRQMWSKYPNALIGVGCGKSGVVVIDLDTKNGHNGPFVWSQIAQDPDIITVEQTTQSGGKQLIFKADPNRPIIQGSNVKGYSGVDIRNENGYFIAAPSVIRRGERLCRYSWTEGQSPFDMEPAEMPDWLWELFKADAPKADGKKEEGPFKLPEGPIPAGSQDTTMFKFVSALRAKGMREDLIRNAIREQLKQCPPAGEPWTEADIDRWMNTTRKYDTNTPEPAPATTIDDSLPESLAEFNQRDIPPLEFYVQDFIPKRGRTMISATTNKGKSIFAQNLALMIAAGEGSFLEKDIKEKARVLYCDLEMGESALQQRFKAMNKDGLDLSGVFVKSMSGLNLLDETHQQTLEKWISELKIELLIIDPLGSSWFGDENCKKEVQGVTTYLNTLIDRFGIAVVCVHHWRKSTDKANRGGEMAAGSYLWTAWLDCHICLEGEISAVSVSCEKARHGGRFKGFLMRLNEESLWFEFLTSFEKKITDETLKSLFELAGKTEMTRKELIEFSTAHNGPKKSTIDKLVKQSPDFEVINTGNGKPNVIRLLKPLKTDIFNDSDTEQKVDWYE